MAVDTLGSLVTKLRHELRQSPVAATGVNMREQLVYILNRTQEELASEYDFPGLTVDRDVVINANARYYNYPTDMPFENVDAVWLIWNTLSTRLAYGIGPSQFALFNSDTGFTSWPVQRWYHHSDDNTFELWPVPNQAPVATPTSLSARVRMRGTRLPPPMVQDDDLCVLPATLIVLFACVEILADEGAKNASVKADKAKEYLRRLRVRQSSHKRKPFVIGGGSGAVSSRGRIGLDYIPEGYGKGPGTGSPSGGDWNDDFDGTDWS